MIWLLSALLYVHIVGAIFWFGSGMMLRYVLMPALPNMPYEAQHPFLQVIAGNYSRIIAPIGGLTILFGILRGAFAGVFGSLDTPYGITFVAGFVLAIPVVVIGARFIGPTAEKLAAAESRDEVLVLAKKIAGYGNLETGGMLAMLVLMVAMHAGY